MQGQKGVGIDALVGEVRDLLGEVKGLGAAVKERLPVAYRGESKEELVTRTVALYHALTDTLEGFKTDPSAIDLLKEKLPGKQAGYMLGLVNAIYSNDPLSKWALKQSKPI